MERLLTRRQVAEWLGVQPQTIAKWKWAGQDGPPSINIGRAVRYRQSDVEAWLWKRAGIDAAAVAVIQNSTTRNSKSNR